MTQMFDMATAAEHSELHAFTRPAGRGKLALSLLVPDIHCAGCIKRIEDSLHSHPSVTQARVNFSSKRVAVEWEAAGAKPEDFIDRIKGLGFKVYPFAAEAELERNDKPGADLLKSLAVAGFAAANIMLLSVSVWSGAAESTRVLFHWISALIALPAVVYAGRPFYRSAFAALKNRQLNMDVPISLAVILATGMSLAQTIFRSEDAYFDAAVMLLFFLLIGRSLDHMMREKARSTISHLLSLSAPGAMVIESDGQRKFRPTSEIHSGMQVFVAAGERIPVDGVILRGTSDLDRSIVTGEATPEPVSESDIVQAGIMNLTGPLELEVTASGENTFLAEMIRLMEAAEQGKADYVRLANTAARIYAPAVHIIAALTFTGWFFWTGGDAYTALLIAISVLIITCPCALGLAVPVVQTVASSRLFQNGIMLKDGAALEKLAGIDAVVFDKTGTLTLGQPKLVGELASYDRDKLAVAAALARESLHPLSAALYAACSQKGIVPADISGIQEVPGNGLKGVFKGDEVRLGHLRWCGAEEAVTSEIRENVDRGYLELCFRKAGESPLLFYFEDQVKEDAHATVDRLRAAGLDLAVVSGDRPENVERLAATLGIEEAFSRQSPADKVDHIQSLETQGRQTLMVGDGINDAPALASAHVSMAPSSASDIGRTTADFVFLGDGLRPVAEALSVARSAVALVKQNFALAILYNLIALPIAILGGASPLVAAIAMSLSSIIVTLNSLRLRLQKI